MKTIRVTGKGQIKVHPDMTRVTIELEGTYKDYAKTLRRSSEDTEAIKDLLVPFGFERTDLKTLSFGVETEYESYQERRGDRTEYKRRFVGYKYTHRMKVEFESANDRLGKILYALAACPLDPEFSLSYTVKDPEAAKNLLKEAGYEEGQIAFELSMDSAASGTVQLVYENISQMLEKVVEYQSPMGKVKRILLEPEETTPSLVSIPYG